MILYGFITLALAGINFWLGYDINRHVLAIQNNKNNLFAYARSAETLSFLKNDLEKAKNEKLFLENILPQPEGLFNFSKDLTSLARQAKVELFFRFEGEYKSAAMTVGHNKFNLVIGGALENCLRFLESLEKSRYSVGFDTFNVANDGKEYRFNINGKVFTQ